MKKTILNVFFRFIGTLLVSIIAGVLIAFVFAIVAYLGQFTDDFALWFAVIFFAVIAIVLSWWTVRQYRNIQRGLVITRRLSAPLDDVLWMARRFNQFKILETYTREEFLRELGDEKRHRPHHPSCDEGD